MALSAGISGKMNWGVGGNKFPPRELLPSSLLHCRLDDGRRLGALSDIELEQLDVETLPKEMSRAVCAAVADFYTGSLEHAVAILELPGTKGPGLYLHPQAVFDVDEAAVHRKEEGEVGGKLMVHGSDIMRTVWKFMLRFDLRASPSKYFVLLDAAGVVKDGPYGFRLVERLSQDGNKISDCTTFMPLLNDDLVNMLLPVCSKGFRLLKEKLLEEPGIAWGLWAKYEQLDRLKAYEAGPSRTSPSRESRA